MTNEPRTDRPDQIDAVLAALDLALYERRASGDLELISPAPPWLAASGAKSLDAPRAERDEALHPFLAHFLHDAESLWTSGRDGRLKSDAWFETQSDGTADGFQATALVLSGPRAILAIELVRDFASERQKPLQGARDSKLHFERLQKEIDKKEMLLHCIVHDLKGPLAGMLGVLSLMKQHELGADRVRELAELGVAQARKQEGMIRGILELFATEISALDAFERDPARAPDLALAARSVADMVRPAFARKGVALVLDVPPGPLLVVGHRERLERVLANLVENALRYGPAKSAVEVRAERRGPMVHVTIDDRGPGIPEAIRCQLFEKFVQDPTLGGTAGLGLYFCRMNVERWGGRIGCEPREGGGSRFWFDLPSVLAS